MMVPKDVYVPYKVVTKRSSSREVTSRIGYAGGRIGIYASSELLRENGWVSAITSDSSWILQRLGTFDDNLGHQCKRNGISTCMAQLGKAVTINELSIPRLRPFLRLNIISFDHGY